MKTLTYSQFRSLCFPSARRTGRREAAGDVYGSCRVAAGMPVPVWGWAEPGEEVTVSIAGQTQKAKADDKGKWSVKLEPLSVGEPLTMVVEGKNRLESEGYSGRRSVDVLGPVEHGNGLWRMRRTAIWSYRPPIIRNIRVITVNGPGSQTPVEDCKGKWELSRRESVKDFSAVGYFFGRELQDHSACRSGWSTTRGAARRATRGFAATGWRAIRCTSRCSNGGTKMEAEWDEAKSRADYENRSRSGRKKPTRPRRRASRSRPVGRGDSTMR